MARARSPATLSHAPSAAPQAPRPLSPLRELFQAVSPNPHRPYGAPLPRVTFCLYPAIASPKLLLKHAIRRLWTLLSFSPLKSTIPTPYLEASGPVPKRCSPSYTVTRPLFSPQPLRVTSPTHPQTSTPTLIVLVVLTLICNHPFYIPYRSDRTFFSCAM